jgi:hypothetical protein
VLGRVVVESEQDVEVVGDLDCRLGPFAPELGSECIGRGEGVGRVLGVGDLGQRRFAAGCADFGSGQHVADLVPPAALPTPMDECSPLMILSVAPCHIPKPRSVLYRLATTLRLPSRPGSLLAGQ